MMLEVERSSAEVVATTAEGHVVAAGEKQQAELARLESKLSNENFVARAPAAVVEKEREKLSTVAATIETLVLQKTKITELR